MVIPFLERIQRKNGKHRQKGLIVVSGLPRSGTSMMMKMLEGGGVPVLTDYQRSPDENNPKGYYEYERVKKLKEGDTAWVKDAQGKAVKVISALLEYLPSSYHYQVIFMVRDLSEILSSQRQMMLRRGEDPDKVSDAELGTLYQQHLVKVERWMAAQPYLDVLPVSYNDLLADAERHLPIIAAFLDVPIDLARMGPVIDKNLYRQKSDR